MCVRNRNVARVSVPLACTLTYAARQRLPSRRASAWRAVAGPGVAVMAEIRGSARVVDGRVGARGASGPSERADTRDRKKCETSENISDRRFDDTVCALSPLTAGPGARSGTSRVDTLESASCRQSRDRRRAARCALHALIFDHSRAASRKPRALSDSPHMPRQLTSSMPCNRNSALRAHASRGTGSSSRGWRHDR